MPGKFGQLSYIIYINHHGSLRWLLIRSKIELNTGMDKVQSPPEHSAQLHCVLCVVSSSQKTHRLEREKRKLNEHDMNQGTKSTRTVAKQADSSYLRYDVTRMAPRGSHPPQSFQILMNS